MGKVIMDCFKNLEWKTDIFGYERLVLTQDLVLRSIEFADVNYHNDLMHWAGKDWVDYTLIRDGIITQDSSKWSRHLKPLEHLVRTIREVYTTNSSKVIVLATKVDEDKYVIGISFSGTVYGQDWINDFKVTTKDGFHAGFASLSEKFDSLADKIEFPNISEDIGSFKVLTLKDILSECTGAGSRFYIWVTGHSQGGGVAISYIVNCLSRRLVLDNYIIGITFAPPTVALKSLAYNTEKHPIYNLINEDDIVTRVGSQIRFGIDICFKPDEDFRKRFYSDYTDPKKHEDMWYAYNIVNDIQDTPTAIILAHSIQKLLAEYKPKENSEKEKRFKHKTMRRLNALLVFSWFSNQLMADNAYKEMTGHDINEEKVDYWYERVTEFYESNRLAGLVDFVTQAHMLNFEQFHTSGPEHSYRGIVLYAWDKTKLRYWVSSGEGCKQVDIASLWPVTEIPVKETKKKSKIASFFSKLFGFSKSKGK